MSFIENLTDQLCLHSQLVLAKIHPDTGNPVGFKKPFIKERLFGSLFLGKSPFALID
ncbi:hypothetical protein C7460_12730 [Marinoscillum furvescens DSM 4134]|uniref:Uncharacterized protein n=1 Tax=Marinoscillum furvescens DSM 4134 TaxID=1122208 RepID=A0A3D9KWW5_MARFU|nr:hypothetical protein C7460_12730 [Marinoscillum furvescens DSM 4134]